MAPTDTGETSITRRSRISPPRLSFRTIKNTVMGSSYSLSIVFIGNTRSAALNARYRKKQNPTNILSFPLSPTEGEIFLNLHRARAEAQKNNVSFKTYTAYLLIHGMLHLKGMTHGSTMEKEEKRLLALFGF